jgi:hypothetical protein
VRFLFLLWPYSWPRRRAQDAAVVPERACKMLDGLSSTLQTLNTKSDWLNKKGKVRFGVMASCPSRIGHNEEIMSSVRAFCGEYDNISVSREGAQSPQEMNRFRLPPKSPPLLISVTDLPLAGLSVTCALNVERFR